MTRLLPPSQLSGRSPIADIEDQGYKGKATQIKEKEAHCLCLIQHIGCPLCLAVARQGADSPILFS
jgi:hypothetical protein